MNLMQKNEYMRARLVVKPEVEAAKAALDKERTVDTWYDYGMALSHAGRSEEAVDAYSQGLVEYPFSSMLYFARGRRFMGPKQYDRAIADFTMALRLEPDVYLYWYYRAVTNNLRGDYAAAIYDFRQALRFTQPLERYCIIDWLFTCYVEAGDKEGARKVLDEIGDDLPSPDMDYDYKQRVRLYKGLETPETLIDRDEIRKHVPDPMDDLRLDITTLLFGQYVYYLYHDEQEKAGQVLLEILKDPYEGAFATVKARAAAKERGLI